MAFYYWGGIADRKADESGNISYAAVRSVNGADFVDQEGAHTSDNYPDGNIQIYWSWVLQELAKISSYHKANHFFFAFIQVHESGKEANASKTEQQEQSSWVQPCKTVWEATGICAAIIAPTIEMVLPRTLNPAFGR